MSLLYNGHVPGEHLAVNYKMYHILNQIFEIGRSSVLDRLVAHCQSKHLL